VRRAPLVALAALGAALTLGGCGSLPPGAAAVVDGTTIKHSEVTDLAEAQCAGIKQAARTGQAQEQVTPRKQLVQQALSLLMDVELSLKYAESVDVSPRPRQVAATYAQIEPLIETLPEQHRDYTSEVFRHWAEARDVLTQIGMRATGQQDTPANSQNLINAGYERREPWLEKVEIHTDPRYGPAAGVAWPGGGDPSVSKAVSKYAKDADKDQPGQAFLSALPASQKCG
jgi:hypothetical protein